MHPFLFRCTPSLTYCHFDFNFVCSVLFVVTGTLHTILCILPLKSLALLRGCAQLLACTVVLFR